MTTNLHRGLATSLLYTSFNKVLEAKSGQHFIERNRWFLNLQVNESKVIIIEVVLKTEVNVPRDSPMLTLSTESFDQLHHQNERANKCPQIPFS